MFACSAGGPGFESRLRRINRVSQRTVASEQRMLSDALCRGCRWPWSSPYIVVTLRRSTIILHAAVTFYEHFSTFFYNSRATQSVICSCCIVFSISNSRPAYNIIYVHVQRPSNRVVGAVDGGLLHCWHCSSSARTALSEIIPTTI